MKIDNFITRIKTYRQYTDSTIALNKRVLNELSNFIKKHTNNKRSLEDTEKLENSDYENRMIEEIKKGRSSRTCNIKLICLRNFLKYAEIHHEKVMNYREVTLMKETKKKIEALSEQEEQKLLSYILTDTTKEPILRLRDIWIALILSNTWLRVHELCNIKVKDVGSELQVIWKNHQPRTVYLFDDILDTIKSYLELRKEKWIESEYLFCAHKGTWIGHKLSRNAVEHIIRQAWKKAWLTTPVWPHKLRHTFATKLLRRGGNIFYIKELLWHSNLSTTQTYLTATNEDLRKTQNLLKDPIQNQDSDDTKKQPI